MVKIYSDYWKEKRKVVSKKGGSKKGGFYKKKKLFEKIKSRLKYITYCV